jgi:drug/metabolite transporter (DMT)-like permease
MSNPTAKTSASFWSGLPLILITLACWTSIPPFLKFFKDLIDGWTANGWRYGLSALLWLPPLLYHAWKRTTPDGLWKAALVPSLFNIGAQICFGLAPYYLSPSLMTFALRLQVVFLMLGAAAMFPTERKTIRSPLFLAGLGMLLSGTIATLAAGETGIGGKASPTGIMLAISSGFLYAGYALSVRKRMHGTPPLLAFAAVSQYTGAALVLAMLIWGRHVEGHTLLGVQLGGGEVLTQLTTNQLWLLFASAIIGIGIGHTLYYASIQRLGLALSSGMVQLQPVTVSIASWLIFHDMLRPLQWVTGAVAIGGAVAMLIAQHRSQQRERAEMQAALRAPEQS